MLLKSAALFLAATISMGAMAEERCLEPIKEIGGYVIGGADQPKLTTERCAGDGKPFPYGRGNVCGFRTLMYRILGSHDDIKVPAGSADERCKRVGCSKQAVIYVCNDNDEDISIKPRKVAWVAHQAWTTCSKSNLDTTDASPFVAGQYFTDEGWNVILTLDGDAKDQPTC